MTTMNAKAQQREDIEALLPWHAAGTLSRRDAERVEAALANDNELARRYDMVREELGETIRLNESLGAPSSRAMERLMAGIEADGAVAGRRRMSFNIGAWFGGQLSQLRPRTLAWSATAAALAIVLQAGLIAGLYSDVGHTEKPSATMKVASYQEPDQPLVRSLTPTGVSVLVRFAPTATAEEITKFLEGFNKAKVVGGPSDGYYTVRIPTTDDVGQVVRRMKDSTNVIRTALPGKG
jgi:anti-sigma-K factor RskA